MSRDYAIAVSIVAVLITVAFAAPRLFPVVGLAIVFGPILLIGVLGAAVWLIRRFT